jgi:hypothetical protein
MKKRCCRGWGQEKLKQMKVNEKILQKKGQEEMKQRKVQE